MALSSAALVRVFHLHAQIDQIHLMVAAPIQGAHHHIHPGGQAPVEHLHGKQVRVRNLLADDPGHRGSVSQSISRVFVKIPVNPPG